MTRRRRASRQAALFGRLRARKSVRACVACAMGFVALIWLAAPVRSAQTAGAGAPVEGVVRDSSGAAVPGAQVEVHAGSFLASTVTDSAGAFAFENVPGAAGTLVVSAKGVQEIEQAWTRAGEQAVVRVQIVLAPASINQQVQVRAYRAATLVSDVPVSDVQLTREDLQDTPALQLDDDLRQVPGFSLYRRAGRPTADPASEGGSC